MNKKITEKIIVALDSPNIFDQMQIVKKLGDNINFYKIGLSSLASGGLGLANELKENGKRIFLDLKLFDIGNTIEAAVKGLSHFDIDFLTVHGDPHIIRAAVEGKTNNQMKILAVTILTSLSRVELDEMLIKKGIIENLVKERANLAFESGADGVICSPNEIQAVRSLKTYSDRLIVTPGIRANWLDKNDQKRIGTPSIALKDGADYLVIGRPITGASNPLGALNNIIQDLRENFKNK